MRTAGMRPSNAIHRLLRAQRIAQAAWILHAIVIGSGASVMHAGNATSARNWWMSSTRTRRSALVPAFCQSRRAPHRTACGWGDDRIHTGRAKRIEVESGECLRLFGSPASRCNATAAGLILRDHDTRAEAVSRRIAAASVSASSTRATHQETAPRVRAACPGRDGMPVRPAGGQCWQEQLQALYVQ